MTTQSSAIRLTVGANIDSPPRPDVGGRIVGTNNHSPRPPRVRRYGISPLVVLLVFAGALATPVEAARIKDIAYFIGDRNNSLNGYGLLVGLDGTGDKDKTQFTNSTLANLLDNSGIHVDPTTVKVKNVAAVMVTANLPAFVRNGSRIDVQISSIGDATSLQGGTLLLTPLKGPDGKVYAVAQGPISLGGFSVSGGTGTAVQKNHPTVGFISGGAIVEREVPVELAGRGELELVLQQPDFNTANKAANAINMAIGSQLAKAVSSGTVKVTVPGQYQTNIVQFIAQVETVTIQPDSVAKVVINGRTGTIVMGENVTISPVAVAHGNLTIQVSEQPAVSQPLPFANGRTQVVPQTQVNVQEGKGTLHMVNGVTIGQVVKGLNAIGATAQDLSSILQTIKAAGAMQAEMEII